MFAIFIASFRLLCLPYCNPRASAPEHSVQAAQLLEFKGDGRNYPGASEKFAAQDFRDKLSVWIKLYSKNEAEANRGDRLRRHPARWRQGQRALGEMASDGRAD